MYEHTAYLGLGGNLEDPKFQLKTALQSIAELTDTELVKSSSFYGSKPQGPQDQPDFINAVCQISTNLSPYELLAALQKIEKLQGKVKKRHWGERLIDLDILLFDDVLMTDADLSLPHPHMHSRDFVLIPLAEILDTPELPCLGNIQDLISKLDQSYLMSLD